MPDEVDWKECWTLDQYVVHLLEARMGKSPEFAALVRVFGREKLKSIWDAHRETSRPKENTCAAVKPMPRSESQ